MQSPTQMQPSLEDRNAFMPLVSKLRDPWMKNPERPNIALVGFGVSSITQSPIRGSLSIHAVIV